MDVDKIDSVKKDYQSDVGKLAIEICEEDPMFWASDEDWCRYGIENWIEKIKDRLDL